MSAVAYPRRETRECEALDDAIRHALEHLVHTQDPDGSWHGDYGGPMFLLPMYVGTCHAAGVEIPDDVRRGMLRYFRGQMNEDGGIGLHVEGHSMVFTSVLGYVAMRLLGADADDPDLVRLRRFFSRRGGPLASASWGKYFLAFLGLYDYRGVGPVPPELWLLPRALPVHPGRLWCHCRMVYLPLSYLYGVRYQAPQSEIHEALRGELYAQPYQAIDWAAQRGRVAESDSYTPVSTLMKRVNQVLHRYEESSRSLPLRPASARLRRRALDYVLEQIRAEDRNTSSICIGPVSKLFHILVWSHANPGGPELQRHAEQLPEYLYSADDGVKMQGYNSSQLWDTAFAVQAMAATGEPLPAATLEGAARFIEAQQVREDVPERERFFRGPSEGGWPFSTRSHGWPISDCTAEGLRASLDLRGAGWPQSVPPVDDSRLSAAADLILSMQNRDGGWATYENTRGPRWLELLNPSNCFGDIMIDYSHVECTSAAMHALARYRDAGVAGAADREQRIARALERGEGFLTGAQRPDGSWEGFWGVCFTYGTWFGISGLRAAGIPASDPRIERAGDFLAARQRSDGAWGELAASNYHRRYVASDDGQAVMTAWAILALLGTDLDHCQPLLEAAQRGVAWLIDHQRDDGSYPPEHIAGMFNRTSAIHYDNYLKVFPLWALAEARRAGLAPHSA